MKVRVLVVLFIGFCACCSKADAQFLPTQTPVASSPNSHYLSSAQFLNAFSAFDAAQKVHEFENLTTETISHSRKSPILAAGLSLILPGLGEYYVGDQIWRGIIFTSLDAALWYGHFTFLSRGDDSTAAFQAYADANWQPSKYADSLNMLLRSIQREEIPPNFSFSDINKAEDTLALFLPQGLLPLSHRLPMQGSQQYYELISKYIQFTYGWRDAQSSDPTRSAMFQRHAEMRANMNAQYETADYFLFGLIVNRVLSAIDAVLLTRDHNSAIRLQSDLRLEPDARGMMRYVSTASLSVRF